MAIDPNRWTVKTQEAWAAAADMARTGDHAEITPTICWPPWWPSPTAWPCLCSGGPGWSPPRSANR